MNEMKQLMTELTDRLRKTNEYNQYINVLSRLKQDSELYARIGDYRRRSLWIQMQEGEAFIQGNNGLQKDFADLQENGLANEFFAAEHQYIAMVKELQEQFFRRFGSGNILFGGIEMNDPYTRKLQVMLNSARYLLAICVNILVLVLILYGVSRVCICGYHFCYAVFGTVTVDQGKGQEKVFQVETNRSMYEVADKLQKTGVDR